MLEIVIKYILGESRTIRDAPASTIVVALGILVVVWVAMDWRYAGVIAVAMELLRVVRQRLSC